MDRCFVFLLSKDRTTHYLAHMWFANQVAPDPEIAGTVIQQTFPWLTDMMMRREDIVSFPLDLAVLPL